MSEFLQGELGSSVDGESSASISRVIIAGNSVTRPDQEVDIKAPVSEVTISILCVLMCIFVCVEKIWLRFFYIQCLTHVTVGRNVGRDM